jgi:hypothetical protein
VKTGIKDNNEIDKNVELRQDWSRGRREFVNLRKIPLDPLTYRIPINSVWCKGVPFKGFIITTLLMDSNPSKPKVHNYNTRAKDDIHMYNSNLSFGRKCASLKAGYFWNTLPDYLKTNMSVKLFKPKLW